MRKNKTAPFLGAIKLSWCDACNLPILDGRNCGVCKETTRKVRIAPPGDIRPAFSKDISRIAKLIDAKWGNASSKALGLTGERLVLLNEVGYDDMMEEVVIDGQVIGSIRYDIHREDWDFVPRWKGGIELFAGGITQRKKYVIVDDGAIPYIEKGYNVLAPGVVGIDEELKIGESAVVLTKTGQVLSIGIMKINAVDLPGMERGMVLKPKYYKKKAPQKITVNITAQNQTWDQAVLANEAILNRYRKKAIRAIVRMKEKHPNLPLSVSFSGGKDSLVCLHLAMQLQAIDFMVLFVNTSLEFPETLRYIDKVIEQMGLSEKFCKKDIPDNLFWESVEKFGPPGKDYRYCCKILKIGPVNELIDECIGKKTLSLIGQRAYESISRSASKTLWTNPWIPNQVNFTPIQKWTALHIWLYIFQHNLFYNPLYEEGFSRIGCWLCPASDQGVFEIIKDQKPTLWENWQKFLEKWQRENNLPPEWISWGLWRWQKLPKKILALADEKGISLEALVEKPETKKGWQLGFTLIEGFATCRSGDFIVEGSFEIPLNLPRIIPFLEIFAEVDYDENLAIVKADTKKEVTVTISADGALTASAPKRRLLLEELRKIVLEIFRVEECTGCKVCLSRCPTNALSLNEVDQIELNEDLCTSCEKCHFSCPIVKFGRNDVSEVFDSLIAGIDD